MNDNTMNTGTIMNAYERCSAAAVARRLRGLAAALVITAALAAFTTGALAAQGGGFSGPGPDMVTVKEALNMRDDARVTLKGSIVRSLGDEAYTFKDATGTIEVEIDNDVWRGLSVGPEDIVVISGEIDKDWNHISVDVSTIRKQ